MTKIHSYEASGDTSGSTSEGWTATSQKSAEGLPPLGPSPFQQSFKNRSVSRWLLVCGAWVSGVILVGAITRLTESGLSMTKWKPLSPTPPRTPEEWEEEFQEYLKSVEGQQRGPNMSMEEFQFIFFWEWFHRVLARGIGVVFAGPLIYFASRGYIKQASPRFKFGLGGVFFLGGCQGAMGWYMVKSGLSKSTLLDPEAKATVSAYRLAAHLTLAFTILSTLTGMAFSLRVPTLPTAAIKSKGVGMLRRVAVGTTGLMFTTAVSGAFVAGLDAGLLYNDTFPLMGEGVIPPWEDLTYKQPLIRNIFENGSAAQLWHRLMAGATTVAIISLNVAARRTALVVTYPHIRKSLNVVNTILGGQILLGVGTLLTYVHTHVAATHQAGALTLLTSLIYFCALLFSKGRVL